ncbi:MAG: hypothetical protein ACRDFR_02600 [Candidatus Limnocylindria bacterium]
MAVTCPPIELRGPTGDAIDLTGQWAGSGILAGDRETAWLQQIGDCVFGSVIGGDPVGDFQTGETITNLSGHLGADFTIDFEVVIVAQTGVFQMGEHSTMVVLVEWDDDGRIRLREDRQPGATAGRCIHSQFECPAPVIWYRLDEGPSP